MGTRIDEAVLQGIFNAFQSDHVTTEATFWNLPHEPGSNSAPRYKTIFVPGDNELVINGQVQRFNDGAFVFQRNGQVEAMPGRAALGGGVTVEGGPARPIEYHYSTNRPVGNMATLTFTEGKQPGTSTLSMHMPEYQGAGFHFRYPAANAEDLAKLAEGKNALVKLQSSTGEVYEGFFAKNSGAVMPKEFGPYARGMNFDQGDFVALRKTGDGRTQAFTFKNYTKQEMDQATRFGSLSKPGNDLADMRTLDGQPINPKKFPQLDVQKGVVDGALADRSPNSKRSGDVPEMSKPDQNLDGPRPTDGQHLNQKSPQLDVHKVDPVATEPLPGTKTSVQAPEISGEGAFGKLAGFVSKVAAPIGLAAMPVIEAASDGYQSSKNGGSAGEVAGHTALGFGKGIVDTYLPGARDGYSNVISGDRTMVDRFLNAASDATGTATTVGATAMVVEAAGVVSVPAEIPTAIATGVSGLANLGINTVKAGLKMTGLAGKDQDGGYIYEGAKAAVNGISHLVFGEPQAASSSAHPPTERTANSSHSDVDYLLRESTGTHSPEQHSHRLDHVEQR